MFYRRDFFIVILLVLATQIAVAQTSISGKVVNKSGSALAGAKVRLLSTNEVKTTDYKGEFAFQTSGISMKRVPGKSSGITVHQNRMIKFHNPEKQNVTLELYNLSGKRISVLMQGFQESGDYQVAIPGAISKQVLILRSQIGKSHYVGKIVGTGIISLSDGFANKGSDRLL